MDTPILCSICEKPLHNDIGNIVVVRQKGLRTLIDKSKIKKDEKWKQWSGQSAISFHDSCRKRYGVSTKAMFPKEMPAKPSTSSTLSTATCSSIAPPFPDTDHDFNFSELCFFCAEPWDSAHKQGYLVKHEYVKDRLIDIAERRDDDKGATVMRRLQQISSLLDVKARYHKKCYDRFSMIPSSEPIYQWNNPEFDSAFEMICNYIENSNKSQFLLSELRNIMGKHSVASKILYRRLKEKYGCDIYISQHRGKETVIFYKNFSISKICTDWVRDQNSLGEIDKKTIITVTAEILRTEIENFEYKTDSYPAAGKFLNGIVEDIPPLLNTFLGDLILTGKSGSDERYFVKRNNIAHSIVSAVRPKSFVSNLQLAVGTYVYRKTGSRLIINLLAKLGVSSSYHHIQQHEASTIMDPPKLKIEDAHVQYIFDNTDHNVSTLDGHRTFHCLGGIAVYTPEFEVCYEGRSKKCQDISASVLASQNQIQTIPYATCNSSGFEKIQFLDTRALHLGDAPLLPSAYSTYLWAKYFNIPNLPSWKGFMEVLSNDFTYSVSHVVCLPFINEPPSKLTTLNTALQYAAAECHKLNQETCFVTFDQPLYLKARGIVSVLQERELKNVVVRLGGFHLLMSYLGAIGFVMDGSGIEDLWSVAYAPESVKKMLSGHAFARAVRAHILTFTALGVTICKTAECDKTEQYNQFIQLFLKNWSSEPPLMGDCQTEPVIIEMTEKFIAQLNRLRNNGPTSQLWIQYFECVVVALQFIEAERLGNWDLHLQSVNKMLPLFHASGHFAYAKSAQIYLQDMANLRLTMNDVEFRKFCEEGFFTIRRSDKPWSGVWSDMTIEQTLNRFFGTDLKHGRGVTPSVVARYLSAMPSTVSIMECLEEYCGIKSSTSEQHVDLSVNRMKKDEDHLIKFLFWLNEHAPFQVRSSLMSLSTGIVGGDNIDCHLAITKGQKGMSLMVGKTAESISLSANYKVKPLSAAKSGIHLQDDQLIAVDSLLLFQRISVVFHGDEKQTREAFEYELSPFPLSLFDEHGFMRKTQKSELYKIFQSSLQSESLLATFTFVIDGGFLLHQIVWPHGKTYKEICNIYLRYILKHYRQNASVVFDGYNNESVGVKSYERYRRRERNMAADVDFSEDMIVTLSQAKFLSNVSNKQKFVQLLSQYLQKSGINVKVASEDADTLIVTTAIEQKESARSPVAVVGNDVDLFVLLIGLTPDTDIMYFYKIASTGKKNMLYSTLSHRNLKPFILFAHAFTGCDTTSAMYGKGKKSVTTMLQKNQDLQELAKIFYHSQSTKMAICAAAEKLTLRLYGAQHKKSSINELRYIKFSSSAVKGKTEVRLAQLPPTPSALHEHAKRVYLQVQQWLGNTRRPEEWGWKRTNRLMLPIMNPKDPAPKKLLSMVFCGCTTDCQSTRCGCRKVGLRCNQVCKNCNGESCSNASLERRSGGFENEVESEEDEPCLDPDVIINLGAEEPDEDSD